MQARPLLNTASLWLQTSFRKQARPLLSTASLSLAALRRFGAVPLLEALTLWRFLRLCRFDASWCFDALALCGSLTLLDALATQRRWTQETAPASQSLRLCGFAALRLCGFSDPWRWQCSGDERRRRRMSRRACGSAARRLCGFAALRLYGFAALRLCGLRVPWQLCGFAACAFHGGFAALRLERSMAALRLWRFSGCARVPEPACNEMISTLWWNKRFCM